MHLNEIRYEQLKNDAMASGAFKRASERGENITLDTSNDATFQLSESLQGKGLLSSRDSFYGKKDKETDGPASVGSDDSVTAGNRSRCN